MAELKGDASELVFAISGRASWLEKRANAARQTFAGDHFLVIAKSNEPALAAEDAHLADVIDIDQRVAMNPAEAGGDQTLLDRLKRERGHVSLACRDDPDDITLGLERQNFVCAEKK